MNVDIYIYCRQSALPLRMSVAISLNTNPIAVLIKCYLIYFQVKKRKAPGK